MPSFNDKIYTAADIEKYHRGQLSAAEMHAMEKAALEDPMLAEAMDGYAHANYPVADDINDLQQRLQKRLEEKSSRTPVVPLAPASGKKNYWWRAAAAVLALAVAGAAIYQIALRNDQPADIAQNHPGTDTTQGEKEDARAPDSAIAETPPRIDESAEPKPATTGNVKEAEQKAETTKPTPAPTAAAPDDEVRSLEVVTAPSQEIAAARAAEESRRLQQMTAADTTRIARKYNGIVNNQQGNDVVFNNKKKTNASQGYLGEQPQYRMFRGQVVDQNNQPVPFANITNTSDRVGTYADANGNFVLISEDSVMNVQVKSVGHTNQVIDLVASNQPRKIELQEDLTVKTRVLDTTYRVTNLARLSPLRHEEPEPVDGWQLYDTYVINNLKMPDQLQKTPAPPTVELSFEVNSMGQPVNIRVVRSLCSECDAEAIRLLREGPRWKPVRKNNRTTVVISF